MGSQAGATPSSGSSYTSPSVTPNSGLLGGVYSLANRGMSSVYDGFGGYNGQSAANTQQQSFPLPSAQPNWAFQNSAPRMDTWAMNTYGFVPWQVSNNTQQTQQTTTPGSVTQSNTNTTNVNQTTSTAEPTNTGVVPPPLASQHPGGYNPVLAQYQTEQAQQAQQAAQQAAMQKASEIAKLNQNFYSWGNRSY